MGAARPLTASATAPRRPLYGRPDRDLPVCAIRREKPSPRGRWV